MIYFKKINQLNIIIRWLIKFTSKCSIKCLIASKKIYLYFYILYFIKDLQLNCLM